MSKWVLATGLALVAATAGAQGVPGGEELTACANAAQTGDWDTVVASCEKALEIIGQEHVGARYYLGWGYGGKRDFAKGIENFEKFLAQAPSAEGVTQEQLGQAKAKVAEYNVYLGRDLFGKKQLAQAMPYFEKAVAADRSNAGAHRFLAITAMQLKDDAKAAQHFGEAARLDPSDAASWYYSGILALKSQDSPKAISSFEKFVGVMEAGDSRASSAFYYLCTLPYNAGDHATAKGYCEQYMAAGAEPGSQTDTVQKILDAINASASASTSGR